MAAPDMAIRLLFATPDQESQELLDSMLSAALELTPLTVRAEYVTTQSALLARANAEADDVIVIDWLMAQADTPARVPHCSTATQSCASSPCRQKVTGNIAGRCGRRARAAASPKRTWSRNGSLVSCASCIGQWSARRVCTPSVDQMFANFTVWTRHIGPMAWTTN